MKWIGNRESDNVEDRRGMSRGGKVVTGGGVLGIIILLLNIFGGEQAHQFIPVLEQFNRGQQTEQAQPPELSEEDENTGKFVKTVFAYTEDTWTKVLAENNVAYRKPKMVLFTDAVETACGGASSASGPFYCPADEKVYMDLAFFQELQTRFGAKGGDFAIAYVIAHEVGHHIQNVLGTSGKVSKLQQSRSEVEANKLSVALELQADFYAGVWAKQNQKYLDVDDIDEALSAAQAVGDDAIQSRMQGQVIPESFTHGTSEQRKYWFMKGYNTGDIRQGDTFAEIH
ncbi:KPN_02809 family neutral zinc metallopeptidase [Flavobacterium psychrophilum]|uniref:Neutral zinc metallopeptidase n=1 Tax=Flavobacterium psychrophilum TaxID=96345 RepID=A0A1L8Z6H5_FLAPS|nr:neutral zinc metallopeptidase [Flavobacterium psychrophilum]AIN73974.1 metalloprotease [Flavobacterium psychrophilum FPG3]EKT2071758.1 neutral zinc metallopeptidase [Flavobacterium psychrophilum]EKT3965879.1 neutral zinc metallopeptidase [Flavobacterium psychrophilum]EKT4501050.1 neutral zinc metallopeptidase [Flavobacterium psychrophilum]EKT4520330.1 neutral zinc metallopeptidase [Flavobacterium psychrophilum]